jgi:DNA-nicking Smr family endonuclease
LREYNERAAHHIFKSKNPSYPSDLSQIDLHGLFVNEALVRTAEHLGACRKKRIARTTIITGKGNRSRDGEAKIKPAVEAFLKRESGITTGVDRRNEGCLLIEFNDVEEDKGWCVVM